MCPPGRALCKSAASACGASSPWARAQPLSCAPLPPSFARRRANPNGKAFVIMLDAFLPSFAGVMASSNLPNSGAGVVVPGESGRHAARQRLPGRFLGPWALPVIGCVDLAASGSDGVARPQAGHSVLSSVGACSSTAVLCCAELC